jgi:hypothetical protein
MRLKLVPVGILMMVPVNDAVIVPGPCALTVVPGLSRWAIDIPKVAFHALKVQPFEAEAKTEKTSPAGSHDVPAGVVVPQFFGLATISMEYWCWYVVVTLPAACAVPDVPEVAAHLSVCVEPTSAASTDHLVPKSSQTSVGVVDSVWVVLVPSVVKLSDGEEAEPPPVIAYANDSLTCW